MKGFIKYQLYESNTLQPTHGETLLASYTKVGQACQHAERLVRLNHHLVARIVSPDYVLTFQVKEDAVHIHKASVIGQFLRRT